MIGRPAFATIKNIPALVEAPAARALTPPLEWSMLATSASFLARNVFAVHLTHAADFLLDHYVRHGLLCREHERSS